MICCRVTKTSLPTGLHCSSHKRADEQSWTVSQRHPIRRSRIVIVDYSSYTNEAAWLTAKAKRLEEWVERYVGLM